MHEVKKPFAGIKKLSIWHGKPFFLLQKPFFLKIKPFKKPFFSQSRVDSLLAATRALLGLVVEILVCGLSGSSVVLHLDSFPPL